MLNIITKLYNNLYIRGLFYQPHRSHVINKYSLEIVDEHGSASLIRALVPWDGWGLVVRIEMTGRWVDGMPGLGDHCVKAIVVISCVGDCPDGAVRLDQRVLTLHYVTVTFFPLVLHVTSVSVFDSVVIGVLWVSL